jgi:hypothetical protein
MRVHVRSVSKRRSHAYRKVRPQELFRIDTWCVDIGLNLS